MGKILFTGLCCLDLVIYTSEFPPEDEERRDVIQEITLGGNATNSVKVCRQLSDQVRLFSTIPTNNPFYDKAFKEFKLDVSKCVRRHEQAPFPMSVNIVNEKNGSRTILYSGVGITWHNAEDFKRSLRDESDFSWFHFELNEDFDYDELLSMMNHVRDQFGQVGEPKISVELETQLPDRWLRRFAGLADVIFVSKDFAKKQLGYKTMEETVRRLRKEYAGEHATVICPWAEMGVAALGLPWGANSGSASAEAELIRVPGHAPSSGRVVDTLAAGDCFIGAAVHYLNAGALSLCAALERATFIAGESVGQRGLKDLKLA